MRIEFYLAMKTLLVAIYMKVWLKLNFDIHTTTYLFRLVDAPRILFVVKQFDILIEIFHEKNIMRLISKIP